MRTASDSDRSKLYFDITTTNSSLHDFKSLTKTDLVNNLNKFLLIFIMFEHVL